jgi:hypothetical protein
LAAVTPRVVRFSTVVVPIQVAVVAVWVALAAPPREALQAMLSQYHYQVTDKTAFEKFGPGTVDALGEIAADPNAGILSRMRAVEALGFFDTAPARAALRRTIESNQAGRPGDETMLLRAALGAFLRAGGDVEKVAGFLKHDSPDVRMAAVRALRWHASGAARLRSLQATETDKRVKALIARTLRQIENQTVKP